MTRGLKRRLAKVERDVFHRIAVRAFMKECLSVLSRVSPKAAQRLRDQVSRKEPEYLKDHSLFMKAFGSELAGLDASARKSVRDDLKRFVARFRQQTVL
jgi:hypothetical protein